MENNAAFEDTIKFSAKGIFNEKRTEPKAAEIDPETAELFAKIKPEEPTESVKAIESLIDRIGKDEALTLEQVKSLGTEIPRLEKKFKKDVEKLESEFEKYPFLVKTESWIRWVSGLNIWLKNEDVIKAKNLLEESKLADRTAYNLGDLEISLDEKINEVILIESAKAVPEFKSVVEEGQKVENILKELDFLVSYTEGQESLGAGIVVSPKPSAISMMATDIISSARNEKVKASVERLRVLMDEEVGILNTSLPHGSLSILSALDDQTSLINIASVFSEGIFISNSATTKKEELETLRQGFRDRLDNITNTTIEVVTQVRKELGLSEQSKKRWVRKIKQ